MSSMVEHLFLYDDKVFVTRLTKPFQSSKVLLSSDIPKDLLNAVYKLGSDLVNNGVSAECILAVRSVIGWILVDRKKGSRYCYLSKYGSFYLDGKIIIEKCTNFKDFANTISVDLDSLLSVNSDIVYAEFYPYYCNDTNAKGNGVSIGVGSILPIPEDVDKSDSKGYLYDFTFLFGLDRAINSYPTVNQAKSGITKSVKWVLRKLGADLPSGAISFRKVSVVDYVENWEVGLKFDSIESVNMFHKTLADKPTPMPMGDYWNWGEVNQLGEDYLLVGSFTVDEED